MPTTPTLGLPFPQGSDTADVPRDMQALAMALDGLAGYSPIGSIVLWPGLVIPTSWRVCDGHPESAAAFPKLALVIPPSGGNVVLPDLRDRVPIGASSSKPVLEPFGEAAHTLLATELPAHAHTPGALAVSGGATTTGGENTDHLHYVAAESRTVGTGLSTINVLPGSGGLAYNHATGGRNTGHVHSVPAHNHTVSGNTGNPSVAGGTAIPLTPLSLALNYIIRVA